jgi:hypothetical protein
VPTDVEEIADNDSVLSYQILEMKEGGQGTRHQDPLQSAIAETTSA